MRTALKNFTAVAVSLSLLAAPAHAGFMDDFYTSAGAAVNVTPADLRKSGSGNFVTGGSVVWRVPQRGFTPFMWQPPRVKAGCGGIDMYMGSFGFANTSQFVDYLRNVGQNALGLFFKMALKAMSPDLEGAVNDLTGMINMFNGQASNSCEMAQNLMDRYAPSQEQMNSAVRDSIGYDRDSGVVSDVATGIRKYAANLGIASTTANAKATNSGGKIEKAVTRNYIWSAMNSGSMTDFPNSMKEIAMSIAGATVVRADAVDPEAQNVDSKPPTINFKDLVGTWNDPTLVVKVIKCDEYEECLNPTTTNESHTGFARNAYTRLLGLRNKIVSRTPLDATDNASLNMLGMTTLPVWKVLELTSSPGRLWLSDEYIKKFSNVIGYELAIGFISSLTYDVEKTLVKVTKAGDKPGAVEHLTKVQEQLARLREEAVAVKAELDRNNGGLPGTIAEIQHLERTLYQNMSTRVMENLKYASK